MLKERERGGLCKWATITVVNKYFRKKEEGRVTYKSGGRCSQIDHVLRRRRNLKEIGYCKVIAGESVAKQHRVVGSRMCLEAKKRKRVRAEPEIKWWKLKKEECCVKFREMTIHALGGKKERLKEWTYIAEVLRAER